MSLFRSLTTEKSSPLLWNELEKILDLKKKLPPDGALLELKKRGVGGEPCICPIKLLFGFHIELASLSFVSKHLTSMLYFL